LLHFQENDQRRGAKLFYVLTWTLVFKTNHFICQVYVRSARTCVCGQLLSLMIPNKNS